MKRTNLYLTQAQFKALKIAARKLHVSIAELVRQAIDAWLREQEEK